jgi:hypothetical protein
MKRIYAYPMWMRMTVLACVGGILYSSWPLGYILNPAVSRSALASALEALHQPYNWVFIGGDVSSSLLMIVICWLLWRHYSYRKQHLFLSLVLANVIIFALGTIADTLLPERCLPGMPSCPAWQHNPLLLIHGIFSILASFCLFLALLFIWWRNRTPLLSAVMVGYIIFGLLSLYEAVGTTQSNFSQHYYITLCSIGLALIPYGLHLAFGGEESAESGKKSKD